MGIFTQASVLRIYFPADNKLGYLSVTKDSMFIHSSSCCGLLGRVLGDHLMSEGAESAGLEKWALGSLC